MITTLRTAFLLSIFLCLTGTSLKAQPGKGEFINVSAGLGLSFPSADIDITGTGFYAQGEYVKALTSWFGLRPYAGVIFTFPEKNNNAEARPDYKVTSKAFLVGGKFRLAAPIPYVAPYFEAGLGASLGKFETYTPFDNVEKSGILLHYPVTLGLALGKENNVDLAFTYYIHPTVDQISGAMAVGFSFPLGLN